MLRAKQERNNGGPNQKTFKMEKQRQKKLRRQRSIDLYEY